MISQYIDTFSITKTDDTNQTVKSLQSQSKSSKNSQTYLNNNRKEEKQLPKTLEMLRLKVTQQLATNRCKYDQIINSKPMFSHQLYIPSQRNDFKKENQQIAEQIMLKQLDILHEEDNLLEKELRKINYSEAETSQRKENSWIETLEHFLFLRKMWTDPKKNEELPTADKIDSLNQKVAYIRYNITKTTQAERKMQAESTDLLNFSNTKNGYQNVSKVINEIIITSAQYQSLKQQNQRLLMEQQAFYSQFSSQNAETERLRLENEQLKSEIKGLQLNLEKVSLATSPLSSVKEKKTLKIQILDKPVEIEESIGERLKKKKDEIDQAQKEFAEKLNKIKKKEDVSRIVNLKESTSPDFKYGAPMTSPSNRRGLRLPFQRSGKRVRTQIDIQGQAQGSKSICTVAEEDTVQEN